MGFDFAQPTIDCVLSGIDNRVLSGIDNRVLSEVEAQAPTLSAQTLLGE